MLSDKVPLCSRQFNVYAYRLDGTPPDISDKLDDIGQEYGFRLVMKA